MKRALCLVALVLCGCDPKKPGDSPGDSTPGVYACGNGALNGFEPCDGTIFAGGAACDGYGLGVGTASCSGTCKIDFSGCATTDYCEANGLYGDAVCDPCDLLGGHADPDCETACAADSACSDVFNTTAGVSGCVNAGTPDPDCGSCGDGELLGGELCDGNTFPADGDSCVDYGFPGGDLACGDNCLPDFRSCLLEVCGNGVIEGSEQCDGAVASDVTCASLGHTGGSVSCTGSCRVSESECTDFSAIDPTGYIAAYCGYLDRCADTLGRSVASLSSCIEDATAHAACEPIYGEQAAVTSCANAFNGASCDIGPFGVIFSGCLDLVAPRNAWSLIGEPCGPGTSCISPGSYCAVEAEATCGTCVAGKGLGEACGLGVRCAVGYFCDGDSCAALLPDESPCELDSNCSSSYCNQGTCDQPIAEGLACNVNDDRCVSGRVCISSGGDTGICSDRQLVGGTCMSDGDCVFELDCVEGVCTHFPACTPRSAGSPCSDNEDCQAGLVCNQSFSGICAEPLAMGADCDDDAACGPGRYCDFAEGCQPLHGANEECSGYDSCVAGYYCSFDTFTCVVLGGIGAECDYSFECQTNECDDGGHCASDEPLCK